MRIDGSMRPLIYTLQQVQSRQTAPEATSPEAAGLNKESVVRLPEGDGLRTGDFAGQIKGAIDQVNTLQQRADQVAASGGTEDTHKAVIAMEHALLSLDFTLQVRNKVLEAYQDIMKTQL